MAKYYVRAELGERFWSIYVPAVDRYTQARHLRELDRMARDLIVIMTDEAPEPIELDVELVMPEEAQVHLDRQAKLREEAAAKAAEASD